MTVPESELPADLLRLAGEDLAIAQMIDKQGLSRVALGFHAQQAVEKALKAVLAEHGVDFPFTHDIALLFKLSQESGLEPPPELLAADGLAPYATAIRYGLGDPASVAPSDAIRWATLTIAWAEAQRPA